jgi:anti-sigma B factor antagonist
MMGVRPSMIRFLKQNRLWDLFGPLIYKSLDDVFKVLKEKKDLPSFYSVAEAERDIMRITLFGSLDADQLAQLDLNAITKDIGNRHCLINLRNLRFVDSSGLVFFLKMQKYVSRNGKMYILCEPTENVYQMFRITKLDHHFQIAQDISVAEKKFKDSALVAAS